VHGINITRDLSWTYSTDISSASWLCTLYPLNQKAWDLNFLTLFFFHNGTEKRSDTTTKFVRKFQTRIIPQNSNASTARLGFGGNVQQRDEERNVRRNDEQAEPARPTGLIAGLWTIHGRHGWHGSALWCADWVYSWPRSRSCMSMHVRGPHRLILSLCGNCVQLCPQCTLCNNREWACSFTRAPAKSRSGGEDFQNPTNIQILRGYGPRLG